MTRQERLELLDVILLDTSMLLDCREHREPGFFDKDDFHYHYDLAIGNIKDLMSDIRGEKKHETK